MKSLYYQKNRWKILLLLVALAIGAFSLLYTNKLVKEISAQERKKMELWASAQAQVTAGNPDNTDVSKTLFDILESNDNIPVILTDESQTIESFLNLDPKVEDDPEALKKELEEMKAQHDPIVSRVTYSDETLVKFIYYRDSELLEKLKFYPLYQLALISLFVVIAYVIFSISRKYEQDYVWVGMAKETAHQLGTPISSLQAWHQLLEVEKDANHEVLDEVKKDVNRLTLIAERFSKIGSVPDLERTEINESFRESLEYLKLRSSKKVVYHTRSEKDPLYAKINESLFNWVIENLTKNAIDAMAGQGEINIHIHEKNNQAIIDFSDTGKGIPAPNQKNVFKPGFSTKKRGWGLGLTLVKRIVENYHKGKIFVKQSSPGKGTTFRIILPLAELPVQES